MNDKVLHVRLNTESLVLSEVTSLGSGHIPCSAVTVEFDPSVARPNRTAMLTLRVPLAYVDLEVVGNEVQP